MQESASILLVEGDADKLFFERICRFLDVSTQIKVAPPKEFGQSSNTKGTVFSLLPTLFGQMADGSLRRFAVIVDADTAENNGMGYRKTADRFAECADTFGYKRVQRKGQSGGIIFESNDGLSDIGLWVMPDNRREGYLEDWIKDCIISAEKNLFNLAVDTVKALPTPRKFKNIHQTKSEVATWLAWQKVPGQGPHGASMELLDREAQPFRTLTDWLRRIFT